jgi:hypothetical protein
MDNNNFDDGVGGEDNGCLVLIIAVFVILYFMI